MPGGVNCDCTVADYRCPLLALAVPNPNTGGISVPIPSLHRADLIAHTGAMNNVALLRQVMFRPVGAIPGVQNPDHPNFTGSNPNFNPAWDGITPGGGQWDVDNMGIGVPDSVWVDLGRPCVSPPTARPTSRCSPSCASTWTAA